eukprot:11549736-Alexandrium_andersonii.AAC.1
MSFPRIFWPNQVHAQYLWLNLIPSRCCYAAGSKHLGHDHSHEAPLEPLRVQRACSTFAVCLQVWRLQ